MTLLFDELVVIKIGGNEAEDPGYLADFASTLRDLNSPIIIVHGGGKTISHLQEAMGQSPKFINGQRYTDQRTLDVAEMVLCGTANKRLVRAMNQVGINALGISGMDAQILQCKLSDPDLGLVGDPLKVNHQALNSLLAAGFVPVISPLGMTQEGQHVNVNADLAAAAIAKEMTAQQLIFLTNVPGILQAGEVMHQLEASQVRAAIVDGVITGGMIPKVSAALRVAEQNMPVRITNLSGLVTGGTIIYAKDFAVEPESFRARHAIHTANL